MHTFFFLLMALIQVVFLLLTLRQLKHNRSVCTGIIIVLVFFGLFYDNLVVGLGSFIGEGAFLQILNGGRFYIHAFFTPLLVMYVIAAADSFGIKWASSKIAYSIFGFLTLGLIGLGVHDDVVNLTLVPEIENGLLRYVNDNSVGPPIPAIVTIVVMMVVAAFIWRRRKWSVLCIGSILMFIAAGAGASIILLANFGELLLSGSIVWTDHKLASVAPELATGEIDHPTH